MAMSGQNHAPVALTLGKEFPATHLIGDWIGPSDCPDPSGNGTTVVEHVARRYPDTLTLG
jgi:hypothetical protein